MTARALMERGDLSFEQKHYASALKDYQAAHALMGVPTTGLAVAQALAATGLLVEARDMAVQVTRMPASPGEPAPFIRARAEAGALAEQLAPQLAALTISVDGPRDGVRVELDGQPIPNALLDLPRSVNPGAHSISAAAPGFTSDRRSETVSSGQTLTLTLVLKLARAVPTAPVPSLAGPALAPSLVVRAPPNDRWRWWAGWVVAGAAAAQIGAGSYFGIQAFRLKSPDNPEAGRDADRSTLLFVTGLATAGAAAYLLLTSSSDAATATPHAGLVVPVVGAMSSPAGAHFGLMAEF